ncbi:hypothetical protein [Alkalihalobacterium bogoriense]|uniref:hypothetical protein n=1 Tax=Alkalihalobacterium bogoriense TaxID=246272 RepID=UPI00047A88B2|nr:hypothetical protein [Alkalihalobacterium bogoriense]
MRDILQQVKEDLEKAYDNPESIDLEQSIQSLQQAKEQFGDKGTLIEDVIHSLEQAKNAKDQRMQAGDISSAGAFGEAYNGLQQAIKSFQ